MSAILKLPQRPVCHRYVTHTYVTTSDMSLYRCGNKYVIPPNIIPKNYSFNMKSEMSIDTNWHQMFACHLPYLNPAYTSRIDMGINIDVQADVEWELTSITWFKTFFGKQFQTYIYDYFVLCVIKRLKETVNLPDFDPDLINNLQDVFNFIKGPIMMDLFEFSRHECFNLLFRLYRTFGLTEHQHVAEDAIISYFKDHGIDNIMLSDVTFDKAPGSLRKHSLVTLAISANNSLLAAFKDVESRAFGCCLNMDRKISSENSSKWKCKYEIVKINKNIAPRERYDKATGCALYYLLYDERSTLDGRSSTTYLDNEKNIIGGLVLAAIDEGVTLDELIGKVSHEFNNGKFNVSVCLIQIFSHVILLFLNINS